MSAHEQPQLRAITYLAPGIPLEFFELVTSFLSRALDRTVSLECDARNSGPMHGDSDPFAEGRADIGFVCSPSYLFLRSLSTPSVELVPSGFVFSDDRNDGRPIYFSEVIVRADRGVASFDELEGSVFGFNDACSLSGFYAARQELARRGRDESFFREERCTGSHSASIRAVLNGDVDVAAIDSNSLAWVAREQPTLRAELHVVESWGPHPIQPIVLSATHPARLANAIGDALWNIDADPVAGPALERFRLERCVPIDDDLYADERVVLERLGQLKPRCGPRTRG